MNMDEVPYIRTVMKTAAWHGAMLLALVVMTLLQSCISRPKVRPVFTFVDVTAGAPAPAGAPPAPAPPPEQVRPPQPARQDDIPDVTQPRTPRRVVVNTNLVRRTEVAQQPPRPTPPRPVRADEILNAIGNSGRLSSAGPVGGPFGSGPPGSGSGGGSGIYDPYLAAVKQAMYDAWVQPGGLSASAGLVVMVDIRVLRDGTLTRKTIAQRSGNPTMDESVQRALDTVVKLRPLPADFRGSQRDIRIAFELTGATF
jgi:TonB family protein